MLILGRSPLLRIGDAAPPFALPDAVSGETVELRRYQGKDILVVFFRGTWCPACRIQMHQLSDNFEQLSQYGICLVGIACQSRSSLKRYLRFDPLPFSVLADEKRQAAQSWGTHYWLSPEGFHLSQPALFILDREHRVAFAHVGNHQRDLPLEFVLGKFLGFLGERTAL